MSTKDINSALSVLSDRHTHKIMFTASKGVFALLGADEVLARCCAVLPKNEWRMVKRKSNERLLLKEILLHGIPQDVEAFALELDLCPILHVYRDGVALRLSDVDRMDMLVAMRTAPKIPAALVVDE